MSSCHNKKNIKKSLVEKKIWSYETMYLQADMGFKSLHKPNTIFQLNPINLFWWRLKLDTKQADINT